MSWWISRVDFELSAAVDHLDSLENRIILQQLLEFWEFGS